MAKGTKSTTTSNPDLTDTAATADDARTAAALPPSPATPVHRATTTFVDLLGGAALQKKLRALAPQLATFKAFKGQSVDAALALVNEGHALIGVADRLNNSAARAHQRVVQINAELRDFETALAQCQASAAEGSDVATELEPLVATRALATGQVKRTRTVNKKRRAAAKKTPPASAS